MTPLFQNDAALQRDLYEALLRTGADTVRLRLRGRRADGRRRLDSLVLWTRWGLGDTWEGCHRRHPLTWAGSIHAQGLPGLRDPELLERAVVSRLESMDHPTSWGHPSDVLYAVWSLQEDDVWITFEEDDAEVAALMRARYEDPTP